MTRNHRHPIFLALLTAVAIAGLTVTACGADVDTSTTTAPSASTAPEGATTSSETPPASSTETSTETSTPPTTGEPNTEALTLRGDGLGAVTFGQSADDVRRILGELLGGPPTDGGDQADWIEFEGWGHLGLFVGFDTPMADGYKGEPRFQGWYYTRPASGPSITTDQGVSVGNTIADFRAAYGDRFVVPDAPDECVGNWTFQIVGPGGDVELYGILDGQPTDDTRIVFIRAGIGVGC